MRLDTTKPVREQVTEAKANGTRFIYDARNDAMGDKAAATALLRWLIEELRLDEITVIESEPGRTSFVLRDYFKFPRVSFETFAPFDEVDGLDLNTSGQNPAGLWEMNPYLAMKGIRPNISMETMQGSTFVFAIRDDADYGERRNMDLQCARLTINALKEHGNVVALKEKEDAMFPEAPRLTMKECIQHIASARAFIGGESGFGIIAAALRKPIVSIYPDSARFGKGSITKCQAIADWWGIPDMLYTPFNCLPNSETLRVVELGTDHCWSVDHVLLALKQLHV